MFDVDLGSIFDFTWLSTCRVRILVVTDSSSGGFDETTGFHLGKVLKLVENDPWPHVKFEFTKAHRQASATADVPNFRFDGHDLTQYSQIWLFGISRSGPDPLSQSELRALSQFMDGGGGVFATGDHENLGQAMAAEVPRVRSMRRWYHPNPGPNGEPAAPDQTGAGRHDTIVDTNPGVPGVQGSQTDSTPQQIRPRFYSRRTGGFLDAVARFPHPVLCGPDGPIRFLPDHMHEGLCEVPANLSNGFSFDGYNGTEYPTVGTHQEAPEVIAWADSHDTTTTDFGVLAAYDGHRANVGRVLVDATWHHWFNINLDGYIKATTPGDPTFDAATVPKWEAIKAYFRNVGAWLANPHIQTCLRNGGWLVAVRHFDILIAHRSLELIRDPVLYFWQIGTFARDALGRLASQCQYLMWNLGFLAPLELAFDPWVRLPQPDPPPWIDLEELELVALGGAMDGLLNRFSPDVAGQEILDNQMEELDQAAKRGAAQATLQLVQRVQGCNDANERLAKRLKSLC